ncbi:MAG: TusE/DsrC/DsvC family sulfur relay protein [Syntrophobacteraceae bacterium]
MPVVELGGSTYAVDEDGFLADPCLWNKDFASAMAPKLGISEELTDLHWEILAFIRDFYLSTGKCPTVHKTCRIHNLRSADLERLFPCGYRRGACKLAGISFRSTVPRPSCFPEQRPPKASIRVEERVYHVDVRGFLLFSSEWDEDFAVFKSHEMKMPTPLTAKHWNIIRYLRTQFAENGKIPTVCKTCTANRIDITDLGELFPDGYNRGALKIAGLCAQFGPCFGGTEVSAE